MPRRPILSAGMFSRITEEKRDSSSKVNFICSGWAAKTERPPFRKSAVNPDDGPGVRCRIGFGPEMPTMKRAWLFSGTGSGDGPLTRTW